MHFGSARLDFPSDHAFTPGRGFNGEQFDGFG
jgi:hypothetical protein